VRRRPGGSVHQTTIKRLRPNVFDLVRLTTSDGDRSASPPGARPRQSSADWTEAHVTLTYCGAFDHALPQPLDLKMARLRRRGFLAHWLHFAAACSRSAIHEFGRGHAEIRIEETWSASSRHRTSEPTLAFWQVLPLVSSLHLSRTEPICAVLRSDLGRPCWIACDSCTRMSLLATRFKSCQGRTLACG